MHTNRSTLTPIVIGTQFLPPSNGTWDGTRVLSGSRPIRRLNWAHSGLEPNQVALFSREVITTESWSPCFSCLLPTRLLPIMDLISQRCDPANLDKTIEKVCELNLIFVRAILMAILGQFSQKMLLFIPHAGKYLHNGSKKLMSTFPCKGKKFDSNYGSELKRCFWSTISKAVCI